MQCHPSVLVCTVGKRHKNVIAYYPCLVVCMGHYVSPSLCTTVTPPAVSQSNICQLCVVCSSLFHGVFMALRLSVPLESQRGLSSSCPWVFEPDWPGLARANWRAEQTACGESICRSNWRHRWDGRGSEGSEREEKTEHRAAMWGVWTDARTAVIIAAVRGKRKCSLGSSYSGHIVEDTLFLF